MRCTLLSVDLRSVAATDAQRQHACRIEAGSTRDSASPLRSRSPAPASSVDRQRHLHTDEQPLQRMARGHLRAGGPRETPHRARSRTAGNRPHSSATITVAASVYSEDPRVDRDLVHAAAGPARGGEAPWTRRQRQRDRAAAPPQREHRRLGQHLCQRRRHASRRASSGRRSRCSRLAARDSSSAAMFVHAISSSTDTAPNSSHSDRAARRSRSP